MLSGPEEWDGCVSLPHVLLSLQDVFSWGIGHSVGLEQDPHCTCAHKNLLGVHVQDVSTGFSCRA